MKAIHNRPRRTWRVSEAVNYTQRYKKWKQFTTRAADSAIWALLWTIHKDTKNESNSQLNLIGLLFVKRCELYTKIQKMKAIHNVPVGFRNSPVLWTIHKDTKNESNSQPSGDESNPQGSCELYTKIQKMKAIHNTF